MFDFEYKIEGMTCPACEKLVEKRVLKIEGVHSVDADLGGTIKICAEREIDLDEIKNVLGDTEYQVS
jgi:copper chaperone CopZ